MTGCWLIKKNGKPLIEATEDNCFNSFVEGIEVPRVLVGAMDACTCGDTIEIYCELPE